MVSLAGFIAVILHVALEIIDLRSKRFKGWTARRLPLESLGDANASEKECPARFLRRGTRVRTVKLQLVEPRPKYYTE